MGTMMPSRKIPTDPQLLKDFLKHPEWTDQQFSDLYKVTVNTARTRRRLLMARFDNPIRGASTITNEEFANRVETCLQTRYT